MRRHFQSVHCIHFKEEGIGRFEGLLRFKWNDLGEEDVIGQGSFGAVFITKTRNKDEDSARKVETVVLQETIPF